MEALSAFITIVSIIAIVLVAGGLIAFVGHMIIGAFDGANRQTTKTESKNVMDYSQYKQFENAKQNAYNDEYNFEAINASKAEKERQMLENEKETIFELDEDKDEELEEIENRLKEKKVEEKVEPKEEKVVPVAPIAEEDDDLDLDEMLSEISDEVIEEEKAETETEVTMSEELKSYSIEDMLKQAEEELVADVEEEFEEEVVPEVLEEEVEEEVIPEVLEEDFEDEEENIIEEIKELKEERKQLQSRFGQFLLEDTKKDVAQKDVDKKDDRSAEIEALKAQLAELNRQLELARETKVEVVREVVKIDITEEECVQKIEMLEERLKNVKKDYKINLKEYKPLKKVMNDLERYQTKLRRKEAIVAKKKVALYGVNNYVDIDKEKAEKLANELELLDGLRLSVSHCEEVISANKDRFPILEHTNQILEDQIAHIETDLAQAQETLRKIRERNGNGEGSNEGNAE